VKATTQSHRSAGDAQTAGLPVQILTLTRDRCRAQENDLLVRLGESLFDTRLQPLRAL